MRRPIVTAALAGMLLAAGTLPVAAQQSGVVIQNNGVDSVDSAAGADNVNISMNPGNGQSLTGGGLNNETGTVVRERDRKDRGARNNAEAAPAEEYVAPAEEYVAPAEGYQTYSEATGEVVEPVAAPEAAPVDSATQQQLVLKLPSTGVGSVSSLSMAAPATGLAASLLGTIGLRRRRIS